MSTCCCPQNVSFDVKTEDELDICGEQLFEVAVVELCKLARAHDVLRWNEI